MAVQRPAAPVRDPIVAVNGDGSLVTKGDLAGKVNSIGWITWLRNTNEAIAAAPQGFEPLAFENQTSAVAATAFPTDGDLSAGLYRVGFYGQVITPAGVSSSFQVTVSWTFNGITQSAVFTLNNGNLTTTREFNGAQVLAIDAASPITLAVAYASNPANAMAYTVYGFLERLAVLG